MFKNQLLCLMYIFLWYSPTSTEVCSVAFAFYSSHRGFMGLWVTLKPVYVVFACSACENQITFDLLRLQHRVLCSLADWRLLRRYRRLQCKPLYLHLQEMKAPAPLSSVLTVWSHKTCSTFCSPWTSNGIVWESVFLTIFRLRQKHDHVSSNTLDL